MSTASSADDSTRTTVIPSPPITAALKAELPKLNPEIAAKVRDVVARKSEQRR